MLTVFGWIFNADFNNLAQMRNSARVMLLVTTKFLYFICTRLILKLKKGKGYSLSGKEWLMVLCIFFVTLTIGIMMFEAIWKEDYNDTVLSMFAFGLIFINVIMALIIISVSTLLYAVMPQISLIMMLTLLSICMLMIYEDLRGGAKHEDN